MMGTSHAISGASLWLAGWAWTSLTGWVEPGPDVLTVGTALAAGAALLPDFDHPDSRMANSGGIITEKFASLVGRVGAALHAATKLEADRPRLGGHRTVTHTFLFAALFGAVVHLACGTDWTLGPVPAGKLFAALLVLAFTSLGYAAIRSFWGGRRRKWKIFGGRWHKHQVFAVLAALATYLIVPANAWWIGLAVGVGCAIHCLGDIITESGCPVLWPIPIRSTELVYQRKLRTKTPTVRWRTWHLVGTPRWMRFKVRKGSTVETVISWALVVLAAAAVAGIIWSGGWGPNSLN